MDFPKQAELADIGIREVVTENPRIPLAVAQQPGTDVNTMVNVSAVMGDQVVGQITAVESGLFLASAKGQALDKYLFDRYGLLRPGATPALGSVSFSTTIPAVSPFTIPINTVLSTATGIQFLTVVATPYPIGSTGPVVVAVRSLQAGLNQRAGQGTITNIVGTIPGQPTDLRVTNPLATSGGDDQMGDVQFRTVGRNFFVNAGKGTLAAIAAAALRTPGVVRSNAYEVLDAVGRPARFVMLVIADKFTDQFANFTAVPPTYQTQSQQLALAVFQSLADVRAGGIYVQVMVAQVVPLAIQLSPTFRAGANVNQAAFNARVAAVNYTNGLNPGQTWSYEGCRKAIAQVTGIVVQPGDGTILSPVGDVVANPLQVIRTGLPAVRAGAIAPDSALVNSANPDAFFS